MVTATTRPPLLLPLLGLLLAGAGCSLRSLDHLGRARAGDSGLDRGGLDTGGAGGSIGGGGTGGQPPRLDGGPEGPSRDGAGADRPADGAPPLDGGAGEAAARADATPSPPDGAPLPPDAPPGPQRVFFVVGTVPPSQADGLIQRRLVDRGLEVTLVDDDRLAMVDTGPAALIVISQSASTETVGARFRDVAKPVMLCEPLLYDDMGMVSASVMNNRGTAGNVTSLRIEAAGHPLAAGLTGEVVVTTAPANVAWGMPGPSAIRVGSVVGQPTFIGLFAYDIGVTMPELVAPARRVALFISQNSPPLLTAQGWALMDAAVTWTLQRP